MTLAPVIIDLETRSACNLPREGGWRYAAHPTTRLLTVSWSVYNTGVYSLWFPGLQAIPEDMSALHLPGIRLYYGGEVPAALVSLKNRTWIAHNAFGFDSMVWRECTEDCEPAGWIDSLHRAAACGMPGGLNRIGLWLWGEGKYEAGHKEAKKAFTATSIDDCEPENVPLLRQVLTGKYNVQDVRLLDALWARLETEWHTTPAEEATERANNAINARGVRIDFDLLHALHHLADEAKSVSIAEIVKLTDGALPDEKAVQSRNRMLAWLTKMGVWEGTSLRKNIVSAWIDEHEEADDAEEYEECKDIQLVVKVLRLRQSALRITGGKLDAAALRMNDDRRIRGVFGYNRAHTGRWTSTGVQLHNLPRPKKGVDTWKLLDVFNRTGKLAYDDVRACLPIGDKRFPGLSVDDAASGLLKALVTPDEGKLLATADLAQIEARMLAWLAGEKWLLDMFWDFSGDPYIKLAIAIMGPVETWPDEGVPYNKHSYRQLIGKVCELAAGFGQGSTGFRIYCEGLGIDLADYGATHEKCIYTYRKTHPAIAGEEFEYKGKPYFKGGMWTQLNTAAICAVETGLQAYAGKISFQMEHRNLHMMLPSSRRMVYRNAKIVDTYPFSLDRAVQAVQFMHPRYGPKTLYGGKLCWAAGTPILTQRGVLPIESVIAGDSVWDGHDWVSTDGVVCNGHKETGRWLGESVTAGHLIHDGTSWSDVTHLDEKSSMQCLKSGRSSVRSLLAKGNTPIRTLRNYVGCSLIRQSVLPSAIDTQEWSLDVPTKTTKRGSSIGLNSSDMLSRTSTTILSRDLIWTEETTTETTCPGTSDAYPENLMRRTAGLVYDLLNCGPRHSYTVMTKYGPILAHNCENAVQASARDVLASGIVSCEDAAFPVMFHVHDEIGSSVDDPQFDDFMRCITTPPEWLDNFPLVAEGGCGPRYSKAAFPQWNNGHEVVYRNGVKHK